MITVCIQGDKYEFSATIDTGNGGIVPTLGVDKMNIEGDKVTIFIGDKEYTFDKKGEASPEAVAALQKLIAQAQAQAQAQMPIQPKMQIHA